MPVVFERKSIPDLYGTLSSEVGIDRHKKKVAKADAAGVKLIMAVEGTLTEVLGGCPHSKADPDGLVKRVFTFMIRYGFQPVFCNNRSEMKRYMTETWEAIGRNWIRNKTESEKRG